jgi:hypothetical protein
VHKPRLPAICLAGHPEPFARQNSVGEGWSDDYFECFPCSALAVTNDRAAWFVLLCDAHFCLFSDSPTMYSIVLFDHVKNRPAIVEPEIGILAEVFNEELSV